jgi:hypothetical protein
LRDRVTGPGGLRAIARYPELLQPARELRADQYGLRTRVRVDDVEIKFEIVFEARIALSLLLSCQRPNAQASRGRTLTSATAAASTLNVER